MACRIGMATDVAGRVAILKAAGTVPTWATYRILQSELTYETANAEEAAQRAACGPHCAGSPGGAHVPGRVWSVYRIDW